MKALSYIIIKRIKNVELSTISHCNIVGNTNGTNKVLFELYGIVYFIECCIKENLKYPLDDGSTGYNVIFSKCTLDPSFNESMLFFERLDSTYGTSTNKLKHFATRECLAEFYSMRKIRCITCNDKIGYNYERHEIALY